MMRYLTSAKFWTPLGVAICVTPFCLLLAVASSGAGHGDYLLAKVFYPFTMLSTLLFGSITWPLFALAVVQFVLYGLICGVAWVRGRLAPALTAVAAAHVAAVAACFALVGGSFS